VHLFSYYRTTFGYEEGDFPQAEYVGKRIVSIPLHVSLTEDAQDYVIETIGKFFYGNKKI
jgi:dTDP-4-amino-4,6-dideoxygalactose transaminase